MESAANVANPAKRIKYAQLLRPHLHLTGLGNFTHMRWHVCFYQREAQTHRKTLGLRCRSLVRFPSQSMTQLISSRVVLLRALVVMAALLSLCVSSNVGPRFLPLPALDSSASENLIEQPGVTISPCHPNNSSSFRVPMMAQAQKRADREPESGSVLLMPGIHVPPANAGQVPDEVIAPNLLVTFPIRLEPPGRAPPDSV